MLLPLVSATRNLVKSTKIYAACLIANYPFILRYFVYLIASGDQRNADSREQETSIDSKND